RKAPVRTAARSRLRADARRPQAPTSSLYSRRVCCSEVCEGSRQLSEGRSMPDGLALETSPGTQASSASPPAGTLTAFETETATSSPPVWWPLTRVQVTLRAALPALPTTIDSRLEPRSLLLRSSPCQLQLAYMFPVPSFTSASGR